MGAACTLLWPVTVAVVVSGAAGAEQDTEEASCWAGVFREARCCDSAHGLRGDPSCWEGSLQFERCCVRPAELQEHVALDVPQMRDGLSVSRSCWREGYNYKKCCTRSRPGGDPSCWEGGDFTFERCCRPPADASAAGLIFEDWNCDRLGGSSSSRSWPSLRTELEDISDSLSWGQLAARAKAFGGVKGWMRRLARLWGGRQDEGCPLGHLSLAVGRLLLCLASDGAESGRCHVSWDAAAKAFRLDSLDVVRWSASNWPLMGLLVHLGQAMAQRHDHQGCSSSSPGGVDWPLFWEASKAEGEPSSRSYEVVRELHGFTDTARGLQLPCSGGLQWLVTVKLGWCIEFEPQCVDTYKVTLRMKMKKASKSGEALRAWVEEAADWNLFKTQIIAVKNLMRHRYTLGLSITELELLGLREKRPLLPMGCALQDEKGRLLFPSAEAIHTPLELNYGALTMGRRLELCRAQCGKSHDSHRRPWALYGLGGEISGMPLCSCAPASELRTAAELGPGNCTLEGRAPLFATPVQLRAHELLAALPMLGRSAPVLSQASNSLPRLNPAVPVFVTMVFGKMAQHLLPFAHRVRSLAMQNVVVFVLDDLAENACRAAAAIGAVTCLRGEGQTALQKYVIVLAYLVLGRDTFWFDFDSVWLKNPLPTLQRAQEAEAAAARADGRPEATVFAAIDFDSKNCPMNAFFLLKASHEATLLWLLSLLEWVYKRPFVHDQLAFSLFLGMTVLVDE
ncbi:unnamed protein product, partial [Polarella glacialis]